MHIDARRIADQSVIEGDICIIGAGAAGISMALDWIDTPHKVILLEGGGFEYDDDVQELSAGETTGQKYFPLKSSRLRYFGGTTGHWAGMCAPFNDIDFKQRGWVPHSGWPITKQDLDPYYAKAQVPLQLGPYNYDFAYWQKEKENFNPLPLDPEVVWNKMWQFSPARFGEAHKETILKAANIHLYTYANAVDIVANEAASEITAVTIKNHAGKSHTVRAKHFILACGAIQNARMLLAANQQAPKGLGNDKNLVGRYFMEHLEVTCAELWLKEPFPTDLYNWPDYGGAAPWVRAELAITPEVQSSLQIMNGTASLSSLREAQLRKPRIETWQEGDPRKAAEATFKNWAEAAEKAKKDKVGAIARAYQMDVRIEQSPNPNSYVFLSEEKDALGVPRGNLNWELTDLDHRSIRMIFEILARQFGAANIGRLRLEEFIRDDQITAWPAGTNGGWHHMGTTRMSDNPVTGVVDPNCKVHGISNLHVAGSSCFVTSAAPNPTLTLVALSLRLSDHLKSQLNT
jgi:choline dehydrogenase-like flavoprotein